MALRLFNTMSSQIEDFRPLRDSEVRMYACGPTVYDYGHIGNFRTFVAVDLLRRFLRQSGYTVRHVMNITDVDDKIIRNSARDGVSVQQYTSKYEKAFLEDAAMIGIEEPVLVRATEHIPEMADFVAKLVESGFAYRTDDGSYYFRIAKFPQYGKLSKKDFGSMSTIKTAPATSLFGRRPSQAKPHGTPPSDRDARAGTSSARSCPWANLARASTCTQEGKI
jgi:cysteinyl-tRNA synthetase